MTLTADLKDRIRSSDNRNRKLLAEAVALRQKVADAEILLFRTYDRDVMTHDGTRDAWEGFHGAAEFIRETQAIRETAIQEAREARKS